MFRNKTSRITAIITLLSTAAIPQTGSAASYLDTVHHSAKTVYTTSLADITEAQSSRATRTLDWQRPSIDLFFDLPPAERTSDIVLTLSADPLTRVAKGSPLQVQFNNSKPVPVRSNGRGFEARLPFDATKSRSRKNVIRITYPTPEGSDCITPSHGAWSIDLSTSTLRIAGRAKRRHMSLSEVSDFLSKPALSPKRIGLVAHGANSADMQALAAQAVSLRTPGVPNFSVTPRGTDFNIYMVKRDRLATVTDSPMILNSTGPRLFVPRGRPTELIFTADTDAEILHMLEIFATRRLPDTRRPITSLGEMNFQNRLDGGIIKIEDKTPLMDLAVRSNIAAGAQSYRFGVEDPVASSGEILLRLSATDNMAENSRLSVALNGKILGAAKLDKKRKTVAFSIKPGTLNATSNILNLVPDLTAETGYTCPTAEILRPEFSVGNRSHITLTKTLPSPVTELSRLTSTGGLFAESESYIVLPKGTQDFNASLRILGRMAKSAGQGLTLADYSRGTVAGNDKHVLIIGPASLAKSHLSAAPKAFRDALSGQSSTGDNLLQADFGNYASAGTGNVAVKYAASRSGPRRVTRGGLAALYGSGNGTLTGVISATRGQSFAQASRNLVKPNHWNALQGGVARWTSSSVVMAQTAQSDADIILPLVEKEFKLPNIGEKIENLEWPDINWSEVEWPDIDWPEIDWPEFDMPQVKFPELTWPQIKLAEKSADTAQDMPTKSVKVAEAKPRLKPVFKAKTDTASGLRGPMQLTVEKSKSFVSFDNIQRNTKIKWAETKRWVKAKAGGIKDMRTFDEVAQATDRLQDKVSPAGSSLKASLKEKFPGKGLVQLGDRTVSVYGLILILAFGLVLLLMSLASPASRLGGRH